MDILLPAFAILFTIVISIFVFRGIGALGKLLGFERFVNWILNKSRRI